MRLPSIFITLLVLGFLLEPNISAEEASKQNHPPITGQPVLDIPPILEWPRDRPKAERKGPDLSEPTSNRVYDLHLSTGDSEAWDLVLSSAGNYHMVLRDFWYDVFLPSRPDLKNWFYTTSPPISPEQSEVEELWMGNLQFKRRPDVAVGPKSVMERLKAAGLTEGEPIQILRNQGNVLLVRKGNPKSIRTVWDLSHRGIKVVTSNPQTEPLTFGNYSESLYQIARQDPTPPEGQTAEDYFDSIFGRGNQGQWLSGARIHHREVPWSLIHGQADAAPIFYHLGRWLVEQFPDQLEIVPLGGTVDQPEPLPGNRVATLYAVGIKGDRTAAQKAHQQALLEQLQGKEFRRLLQKYGLREPQS